jgi:hypothetical protein
VDRKIEGSLLSEFWPEFLLLAATSDQWDFDPWLFDTPGGVINSALVKLYESTF